MRGARRAKAPAAALLGGVAIAGCILPSYEESPPAGLSARWSVSFGGLMDEEATAVAVDREGNAIVGGWFTSYMTFGGAYFTPVSGKDGFVAKYDAAGSHRWSVQLGALGVTSMVRVAVDGGGNALAAGQFTGSLLVDPAVSSDGEGIFLVKLDPAGDVVWSTAFPAALGTGARVASVAADAEGNWLVTGTFNGTLQIGNDPYNVGPTGGNNIYLAKVNPAGQVEWSHNIDDGDVDAAGEAVAADSAGNVILTGSYSGSPTFGGPALPGVAGDDGLFVAKFGPDKTHLWSVGFPNQDLSSHKGVAVAVGADQSIVVAAWHKGRIDLGEDTLEAADDTDVLVLKLGPAGNLLWSRGFDVMNEDFASSAAVDGAGDVIVSGTARRTILLGLDDDVFIAKLDGASGALTSLAQFGDERIQRGLDTRLAPGGDLLLTGSFASELDLGAGALQEHGLLDVFVARLAPP